MVTLPRAVWVIVLRFTLGFGVVCGTAYGEGPPLTIGVILPLSGSAASFGAIGRAAIELALEDLPPEDKGRVRVIFEDDGLVANRSVSAGQKLIAIDQVDALISWSSSTGLSLASITESRRIPHISIASDPAVALGRRYTFTYWALPQDEAQELYNYLVTRGVKRVALLAVTHNGLLAVRDAFIDEARRRGDIAIVASEEASADTQDFRGIMERIRRRGQIDGFIPIFFPGQLSTSVKQARLAGITAPIFGFETFEDSDDSEAANGLFTGVVYATGADPSLEFLARFQKRAPGMSFYTASNCYDAVMLLAQAARERKEPEVIAEFLRSIKDYPAASGRVSATGDNRFSLPTVMKRIGPSEMAEPIASTEH
jgi:ABC-type branched-subunit amino acid transport system substrate-binding protein